MTRLNLSRYTLAAVILAVLGGALAHVLAAGTTYGLTSTLADQGTISGQVDWSVSVSPQPYQVDFYIDGVKSPNTEFAAPYTYNGDGKLLDTTTLSNGVHTFQEVATFDNNGGPIYSSTYVNTGATWSATHKVNVSNTAAAPTVNLSASPTSVSSGGSSTLTWSSTNATTCTASGGWTGTKTTSGTLAVTNITQSTTYTLTCTGSVSATASTVVTVTTSPPPSTGNGIGLLELGDNLKAASSPGRYGMVIVSVDDAPVACALPSPTRSLVYRSGVDVNQTVNYGVDYNTALANGWLLKDANGSYLYNSTFGTYVGDIGISAYQQTWINNVIALAKANNCKGIFIDNVLRDVKTLVGIYPAKYPNVTAWDSAMLSFVSAVGPALKAQGIYVAFNAVGYTGGDGLSNDGTLDVQWWQKVGPYSNGLMNENWMQTSEGSLTTRLSGSSSWMQFWDGWQRLVATAQNINRDFIGLSYGASTNTAIMHYGRGSFLLDWNGGGSVFAFSPTNLVDPWNLAWTSDIGTPTGTKSQIATGVWTRTYSNGVVYVNTTSSTVSAGGHIIGSGDAYIGP